MSKHLLIVDRDDDFVSRMVAALGTSQAFELSTAATTDEAARLIRQQPHDIAFIPVSEGEDAIQALRAEQPNLRVILLTPTSSAEVPKAISGKVQGILLKTHLEVDLTSVLADAMAQPVYIGEAELAAMDDLPVGRELLITTLQQAKSSRFVQSTIFAKGTRLLAHWGELSGAQAAAVVRTVGDSWADTAHSVRIQFIHLPARSGDLLLYSQRIQGEYLLTLAALPETPVHELRLNAEPLARELLDLVSGRQRRSETGEDAASETAAGRKSFALVWRPAKPLPSSLHIPLRRALQRLALANACVLSHIDVQSELLHLVVACPAGRDSVWAAFLFKNGSEATIQQEFNVDANLWGTGYYAIESAAPLSEAELSIFLDGDSG